MLNLAGARGRHRNSKPTLDLWLSWELRDGDGRVVRRGRRRRSHSFVLWFLQAIGQGLGWDVNAIAGSAGPGIEVGSGTAQPQVTDQSLTSLIGSGTGAGQLEYSACDVFRPVVNSNANQATITIQRSFTNQSGGSVTVTETGIGASLTALSGSGILTHDLFASPITVGNGQTLTVTYTVVMST